LALLQLLLGSPNPARSGRFLLGILDPTDELVPGQRGDVVPGIERWRAIEQRLAQVRGHVMHDPTGNVLAAHPSIVMRWRPPDAAKNDPRFERAAVRSHAAS
jgi:hypothetical protein